jgi:serine/threonine-protein kinase
LDENTLIEMARGRAGAEALASAEQHLASCDDCADAMAAVARVVTLAGLGTAGGGARGGAAASVLEAGTLLRDSYRIVRLVGRGGMGEVYEATHTRLSGRYAVKVLAPDVAGDSAVLSRFRREADITSALHHPNIVQVLDFDQTPDGRPFLAMEYLRGRTLAEVIAAEAPVPLARAVALAAPVVSALTAIHALKIVHRDLKPQNVMLVESPGDGAEVVKLLDFGLSKRSDVSASDSLHLSHARLLLGTPMYMAPEQALGQADAVGPATDQFALGAIVYEMLTGRAPFQADSLPAVLGRILHADPPPLRALVPALPAGAEAAVRRALAKAPEQRFPTLKAFLEALQAPEAAPAVHPAPAARGAVERRVRFAATAALVLVAAGALWRLRPAAGTTTGVARAPAAVAPAPPPLPLHAPEAAPAAATLLPVIAPAPTPVTPPSPPLAAPPRPARKPPRKRPPTPAAAAAPTPPSPAPAPMLDLFPHL